MNISDKDDPATEKVYSLKLMVKKWNHSLKTSKMKTEKLH